MSNDSDLNEQIIAQQNQILLEISQSQPLIDILISPSVLINTEYKEGASMPGFIPGLQYLSSKYLMRKVRGDGNCFYRSFLFAYLERLVMDYHHESVTENNNNNEEIKQRAINECNRFIVRIKACREELITLGYSEIAFESFYDVSLYDFISLRNCAYLYTI